MRATVESLRFSLARWRSARRVVLGSLLAAGVVATSTAVIVQSACRDDGQHFVRRSHTYTGIGVVIVQKEGQAFVHRVGRDVPASGKLFAGARLVAVDGITPDSIEGWSNAIRGRAGTEVELEVEYPCGGQKTLHLVRDVVHIVD